MIIWITGFSGAGKTTIAKALVHQLKKSCLAVVLLDGDAVREAINDEQTAYDRESRLKNAYRICRLARMLEEQDFTIVVSTMSLFHEIHDWNRRNFDAYTEIYVRVGLDVLKARNARQLYTRAHSGQEKNVVGIDLVPEEPQMPDLILDNNAERENIGELVSDIMRHLGQPQQAVCS